MSIVTISDLHLKNNDQEAINLWKKFVFSKETAASQTIILLGDIFDLMIGGKSQYLDYYAFFFDSLKNLINSGKRIIYLEGNHDFHLERVFEEFIEKNNLDRKKFIYRKDEFEMKVFEKNYLFCHGDIIDHKNESFKKWKKIYRSKILEFIVNRVLPFHVIKRVGARASKNSKRRNRVKFNYEESKEKYREGANFVLSDRYIDIVISGHTHIKDYYETKNQKIYVNNGFPKRNKCFISIEKDGPRFVSLS